MQIACICALARHLDGPARPRRAGYARYSRRRACPPPPAKRY